MISGVDDGIIEAWLDGEYVYRYVGDVNTVKLGDNFYTTNKEFIKINETSSTIQNASNIRTLEMTTFAVPESGILISPLQKHTFKDTSVYLR